MKEGWKMVKLGEVCEFFRGLTYSKKDEVENSSKVVLRSNNVDLVTSTLNFNELKYLNEDFSIPTEKKVKKDSLLICMANGSKIHLGKTAIIDKDYDYAFGGFMGLITPDSSLSAKYLHKMLTGKDYQDYIKSLSDGANINNLKFKDLANFSFPLPPLSEQTRIVSLLDDAFGKLERSREKALKLLDYAKEIFQAQLKKEMTPKEGWEVKKLGDCFDRIRNGANIKQTKGAGGIPITRIETLSNGVFNYDRLGYADITDIEKYKGYELVDGDILMSHINSMKYLGRSVVYHKQGNKQIIHGMNLLCLKHKESVNPDFIAFYFNSPDFKDGIASISHQSINQASFNVKALSGLEIPLPPLSEQSSIVSRLDGLSSQLKQIEEKTNKYLADLDELKQSLLKKAFEGKI